MKKILKNIMCIFLIVSILFALTGCYDASGIEELAYVVAIGIDLADDDELELSVQIATAGDSSSGESSGSSSQSKETNITTVKCNTINSRFCFNKQSYK